MWGATLALLAGESLIAEEVNTGTVTGVVIYQTDPARPWPYGRYYIKNRKAGRLAESVVALQGAGLKSTGTREPQPWHIDQENYRFAPETIAIQRGDTVRFTNSDQNSHNVSSDSLVPFDTTVEPGGERTQTFDKAGGIRRPAFVGCKLHSGMHAWIYVFDHPFHVVTSETGEFQFADVPVGDYQLQMVHPSGALQWSQPVQVLVGKTTNIEVRVSPDDRVTVRK